MKYLRSITESADSKKKEAENVFELAYNYGESHLDVYYLTMDWVDVSKKYKLYDNFFLYKGSLMVIKDTHSKYLSKLVVIDKEEHISKLEKKLDIIIEVIEKIRHGGDE